MGASTVHRTEADKAKAETKRRRLRRQSARFRSQDHGDGENLFEIEDLQLTMPNNTHQDSSTVSSHKPNTPRKEEEEEEEEREREQEQEDTVLQRREVLTRPEDCTVHRSSIGRPLRRAVEKIHSYKEVPVNTKMRRSQ